MTPTRLYRIGFYVALAGIAVGSLAPGDSLSFHLGGGSDKLVHLGGYFALALMAAMGWPRWRGVALVGLPLLGLALEMVQILDPMRMFSWADALANAIGIGMAVAASAALTRWLQ